MTRAAAQQVLAFLFRRQSFERRFCVGTLIDVVLGVTSKALATLEVRLKAGHSSTLATNSEQLTTLGFN
jgi:hypothetical protein